MMKQYWAQHGAKLVGFSMIASAMALVSGVSQATALLPVEVPEPATLLLVLIGAAGAAIARRRK